MQKANYNIYHSPSAMRPGDHWNSYSAVKKVPSTYVLESSQEANALSDINCTIPSLPDPLFHLLEFYIHNDAPLSCRLPSRPSSSTLTPTDYTHLQFALTGTLQLSHLHINRNLNILLHTTPSSSQKSFDSDSEILAATAYSLPSMSTSQRLVIGDPLPLQLSVRWYTSRVLPASTSKVSGLGGHVHLSTVFYCLLSFGAGGAVSLMYWRGWELPRRMKRYKGEMVGGEGGRGYAWPGSASGNGFAGGKRD